MSEETGLICTGESVRAILDGRKTQTRRVIKNPQRLEGLMLKGEEANWCPYGKVGDRLWVRESYQIDSCAQGYFIGTYQADGSGFKYLVSDREIDIWDGRRYPFRKTSGRFMYKSLARIWLEITGIRVEKVQEISWEDCRAEGCRPEAAIKAIDCKHPDCKGTHYGEKWAFKNLWDSINAKRGHDWDKNCWVWIIEFKKGRK